jgi:hypothetical protein
MILEKYLQQIISENYDHDATGMMSRVPPLHTEEAESTDEQADKEQNKQISWSKIHFRDKVTSRFYNIGENTMIEIYLHLLQEIEKCPEGYRWCPITKKCIPDTDGRGKGQRGGRGGGKGPMGKPNPNRKPVNEYEDVYPNLIDHCLSYDCPKKKIVCLNILRQLNGGNPEYNNIIDRYIDDITGNYNPSGEISE